MSLIADALRKIETPAASLPEKETKPPSLWPYRLGLAVSILAVLAGLTWVTQRDSSNKAPMKTARSTASLQPSEMASSVLLFKAERQMTLSGIVTGSGKPMAVINNNLVEEGETVRGMKLVRVLPDQVEMEKEGKRTVLRLPK
ncbi:MAG: hypothetical protein HYZ88_01740 [Candidatus Omnitrophica bacterium]|nr:hypothetical protein [Candidatus Omnitrophota bacterium]